MRCKILILLGLFAEYREQRGYGCFAEAFSYQLVARSPADFEPTGGCCERHSRAIVRQGRVIICNALLRRRNQIV
jgi:hypothetical protein